MIDNPILKKRFDIFNNQATSGQVSGRLSVYYNVYPAPAIFWEFETPNRKSDLPEYDGDGKLKWPFEGVSFLMPDPRLGGANEKSVHEATGKLMTGNTAKVIVGDQSLLGHSFTFYMPNCNFQHVGRLGRNFRVKEISYKKPKSRKEFGGSIREGYAQAKIKGGNTVTFHTPTESIDWLNASGSIGTYLTSSGELHTKKDISIYEAAQLLDDMTYLLSFANGGFIAPLAIKMMRRDFEQIYPSIYSAYIVDPIEQMAGTWFGRESDICDILTCLPAFQKMLQTEQWKNNFHLILIWYFQAIQSPGVQQAGKPWPIVANALGAALEKLASIILVTEMKVVKESHFYNSRKMDFESKVRKLLEVTGINAIGPKYGTGDAVWWFREMRHSATHPRNDRAWKEEEVNVILGNAIQWVEEALLWRLGYDGKYQDRSRNYRFSISPRYKNDLRDKSW